MGGVGERQRGVEGRWRGRLGLFQDEGVRAVFGLDAIEEAVFLAEASAAGGRDLGHAGHAAVNLALSKGVAEAEGSWRGEERCGIEGIGGDDLEIEPRGLAQAFAAGQRATGLGAGDLGVKVDLHHEMPRSPPDDGEPYLRQLSVAIALPSATTRSD